MKIHTRVMGLPFFSLLIFFGSFYQSATADIFSCPSPLAIGYSYVPAQHVYLAQSLVRVVRGHATPFIMQGITAKNSAEELKEAHFNRDHLFCIYRYLQNGISGNFVLSNPPLEGPELSYCHFIATGGRDCVGNENTCVLDCEGLTKN